MTNSDDKNISGIYKKLATEKPSSELDNRILAAAHEETPKKSSVVSIRQISPKWLVPLTLAATVVLSVSVVLTIPDADFQKPSERDYVIPESVEEQKRNNIAEQETTKKAKLRKKEYIVARKKLQSVPSELEKRVRKDSSPGKYESRLKPAMAPPARSSSVESAVDAMSRSEAGSESSPEIKSVAPRSQAIASGKALKEQTVKQGKKKINFEVFSKNFVKIVAGVNKRKVLELLGSPFLKNNNDWYYQYVINGLEKKYIITFENNLVVKTENVNAVLDGR